MIKKNKNHNNKYINSIIIVRPKILTIAGLEPTGGAGINADLKTFEASDIYGLAVITSVVSFEVNNQWKSNISFINDKVIKEQLNSALSLSNLDNLKIGLLGKQSIIEIVSEFITKKHWKNIILDPVFTCKTNSYSLSSLSKDILNLKQAFERYIIPYVTLITPNYFETLLFSGMKEIKNIYHLTEAAKRIYDLNGINVLVKGGQLIQDKSIIDIYYDGCNLKTFVHKKVNTKINGTGCYLSSLIISKLAKGNNLTKSLNQAMKILHSAIVLTSKNQKVHNAPFNTIDYIL